MTDLQNYKGYGIRVDDKTGMFEALKAGEVVASAATLAALQETLSRRVNRNLERDVWWVSRGYDDEPSRLIRGRLLSVRESKARGYRGEIERSFLVQGKKPSRHQGGADYDSSEHLRAHDLLKPTPENLARWRRSSRRSATASRPSPRRNSSAKSSRRE